VIDRVGLATALAHKEWLKLSGYARDDVISWGLHGLVLAAHRWPDYCRERGYETYTPAAQSWFNTYASRRIIGSIIDELRASDPVTRRERSIVKDITRCGVDLHVAFEYDSSNSISERTGICVDDVDSAISALLRAPISLDDFSGAENILMPVDVEDEAFRSVLCAYAVEVIKSLPKIQQYVLIFSCYYQLSDAKVAAAIPEISRDPASARWAHIWVQTLREEAQRVLRTALQKMLDVSPSVQSSVRHAYPVRAGIL
jgi:DNA-directed RNA polymerase specialized sigma subunit